MEMNINVPNISTIRHTSCIISLGVCSEVNSVDSKNNQRSLFNDSRFNTTFKNFDFEAIFVLLKNLSGSSQSCKESPYQSVVVHN